MVWVIFPARMDLILTVAAVATITEMFPLEDNVTLPLVSAYALFMLI